MKRFSLMSIRNHSHAASSRLCLAAVLSCAGLLAADAYAFDPAGAPLAAQGTVQAAFAPWDNIEGLIVEAINRAEKQVLMQAYLLSSKPIASALIQAARRGIDVRVLVDAEQNARLASSKVAVLAASGVGIWLETIYQAAHNKVIIIDASSTHPTVITGSYNFTWGAQHKNAENVLILRNNPPLAAQYTRNWERHRQHAVAYKK